MKSGYSPQQIYVAAAMLGFFAILGQVVAIREFMAVLFGNELSVGLVFAVWFMGIVSGAWLAGRSGLGGPAARRGALLVIGLLPVLGMVQVTGIRSLRSLWGVGPGELVSLGQSAAGYVLLVFPFSLLVGLAFPVLAQWAGRLPRYQSGKSSAGLIYWLESGGSLLAGVLFTFVFAGRFDVVTIWWSGGALFLMLTGLTAHRALWRWIALAFAGGLVLTGLAGVPQRLDQWSILQRWQAMAPGYRLLENRDTPYQNIAAGERDGQIVVFLDGLIAETFPDPGVAARRVHLIMNQVPQPRRVLFLGHGLAEEVPLMLEYPVTRLTVCFLDPGFEKAIAPYLADHQRVRLRDSRLERRYMDPQHYLLSHPETYDLIVLNPPPPATAALNRFYTRSFFDLCRRRLAPGGVLATQLEGGENFIGEDLWRYSGTLYQTLRAVFRHVVVTPGQEQLYFASDGHHPTLEADVLAARMARHGPVQRGGFDPAYFPLLLPPERVAWLNRKLADSPPSWINTIRQPSLYLHHLKLWADTSGSQVTGLLVWIQEGAYPHIWLMVLVLTVLAGTWFLRRHRDSDPVARQRIHLAHYGIFVFGLAGMCMEIILLYNFQILYGYLYSMIGWLIACFMMGLTAGAWFSDRLADRFSGGGAAFRNVWLPAGLTLVALTVLFSFGRPFSGAQLVIFLQILGLGTLTGMYFPLACDALAVRNLDHLTTAARMDAVDHLGAMVGAGVTGVILLPALGVSRTVLLVLYLVLLLPLLAAVIRRWSRASRPSAGRAG